jgi:tRNA modification GTPase
MAVYFSEEKSFTGDATLEISCHGNSLIVEKILQDLLVRGCRIAHPGEFSRRAFMSGKIDLTQAESIAEIISARSDAELKIANSNLKGTLSRTFKSLQSNILGMQALLEASLDFPEDEIEEESQASLIDEMKSIANKMDHFIKNSYKKKHLSHALKVLLLGPPNAGKSTIFNSILGHERALVSETPGTTRDYIAQEMIAGDYRIELIDCAGIRNSSNETEALGVSNSLALIDDASLVLFVTDGSLPYPSEFHDMVSPIISEQDTIIIENKKDLPKHGSSRNYPPHVNLITVCAHDSDDMDGVTQSMTKHFSNKFPLDPAKDIIVNARHSDLLHKAHSRLSVARKLLESNEGIEIVLQELNHCRSHIDEIIGSKTNEDMLDLLFNKFCIGK